MMIDFLDFALWVLAINSLAWLALFAFSFTRYPDRWRWIVCVVLMSLSIYAFVYVKDVKTTLLTYADDIPQALCETDTECEQLELDECENVESE